MTLKQFANMVVLSPEGDKVLLTLRLMIALRDLRNHLTGRA